MTDVRNQKTTAAPTTAARADGAPETTVNRPSEMFMTALTTPTGPRHHGAVLRGVDVLPASRFTDGRYGRMFRHVPVFEHDAKEYAALARKMIAPAKAEDTEPVDENAREADEDENPVIPAGYTYVGQFVDHDITFDPASSLTRQNDPDALHDMRTPRFDLDSLYGSGPADQPYLYYQSDDDTLADPTGLGFDQRGIMLRAGEALGDDPANSGPDLVRTPDGRAIIGDPRNDENLIVSQLQSLFVRFHNRMVEHVHEETGLTGENLFKLAQQQVRWHYQWMVVNDYLRRIVDGDPGDGSTAEGGVVDDILCPQSYRTSKGERTIRHARLLFYRWARAPFMPIEFSVAAYRFGHSMIRPSYFINDAIKQRMGNRRIPIFSPDRDFAASLRGFHTPLPHWGLDWRFFFDLDGQPAAQRSYRIDTQLAHPLAALPGFADDASLAHRNLIRGMRLGVPSGQDVAAAMGIEPLGTPDLGLDGVAPSLAHDTPLWYYVLREAEVLCEGTHLGPVGGRIVAEVLVGLLAGDPLSYLSVAPSWQPSALAAGGRFGMRELVAFTLGGSDPYPA